MLSLYNLWSLLAFEWKKTKLVSSIHQPIICHRTRRGITADENSQIVYIFGGGCDVKDCRLSQISIFDFGEKRFTNSFKTDLPEIPRWLHSSSFCQNKLFVFGGESTGLDFFRELNDLAFFDVATKEWKQNFARGKNPKPRKRHCSTYLATLNGILVSGGDHDLELIPAPDFFSWFNLNEMKWETVQVQFEGELEIDIPRAGHSVVLVKDQSEKSDSNNPHSDSNNPHSNENHIEISSNDPKISKEKVYIVGGSRNGNAPFLLECRFQHK